MSTTQVSLANFNFVAPRSARKLYSTQMTTADSKALELVADFQLQVRPYERYVLNLCRKKIREFGKDITMADDLYQEVMLRAFKGFARFDGENIQGWLKMIVRNTSINLNQADDKHVTRQQVVEDLEGWQVAEGQSVTTRHIRSAEAEAFANMGSPELNAALGKIKPERRQVFLMHEIDGLKYSEIAEITGIKAVTVGTMINKAKIELRGYLRDLAISEGVLQIEANPTRK